MGNNSSKATIISTQKPFEGLLYNMKAAAESTALPFTLDSSSTGARSIASLDELIGAKATAEWTSNNEPNSWIQVMMCDKELLFTGYVFKTSDAPVGGAHLKSWKLEGITKDNQFKVIEEVADCATTNKPNTVYIKEFKQCGPFQSIRLTMTGPNHFGTNTLSLKGFEVYGKLQ